VPTPEVAVERTLIEQGLVLRVDRDRNVAGGGLGERLLEQVQCDPHVAGRIREEHLAEREQGRSKRLSGSQSAVTPPLIP